MSCRPRACWQDVVCLVPPATQSRVSHTTLHAWAGAALGERISTHFASGAHLLHRLRRLHEYCQGSSTGGRPKETRMAPRAGALSLFAPPLRYSPTHFLPTRLFTLPLKPLSIYTHSERQLRPISAPTSAKRRMRSSASSRPSFSRASVRARMRMSAPADRHSTHFSPLPWRGLPHATPLWDAAGTLVAGVDGGAHPSKRLLAPYHLLSLGVPASFWCHLSSVSAPIPSPALLSSPSHMRVGEPPSGLGLGGGCLVLDHHCCESCLGVAPHRALHIHRVSIACVACHSAVNPHRHLSVGPMASTEHRAELRE